MFPDQRETASVLLFFVSRVDVRKGVAAGAKNVENRVATSL